MCSLKKVSEPGLNDLKINMILTDLKQSFRHMGRRKLSSFIQIIGLGIGLGSVILMLVFILHEYSFDKYHKNCKNIYRVIYDKDCTTPKIMGERFKSSFPEIKNVFCIYSIWNTLIKSKDEFVKENNFILADSSIFTVLDIPILSGNKKFLFQNNNDIVLSDKAARKYFGEINPVGKALEINVSGELVKCNITGLYKHFPSNSSIQSECIGNTKLLDHGLSNQTLYISNTSRKPDNINEWKKGGYQTFLYVEDNTNIALLEYKATSLCKNEDQNDRQRKIHLQPFTKMYFYSDDLWNYTPLSISNLKSMRIFEGIALLILLIALFNYILLSTADLSAQYKEVACRKVLGASSAQIAGKSYIYSLLISLLSLEVALLFVERTIPLFNQLLDKNISLGLFLQFKYIVAILAIVIITGFAGGGYLSIFSARYKPNRLFKPLAENRKSRRYKLNGVMIVFQFSVFIFLLSAAILIKKQINYSETKSPGFNSNNVLIFKLDNQILKNKVAFIRTNLEANPHVLATATSGVTPPSGMMMRLKLGNNKNSEPIEAEGMFIGSNLIELLQIPVISGNTFTTAKKDSAEIIINESAAKKYKVAVGDKLESFVIKGIVKDFHSHSVHTAIGPIFLLKMIDENCYELAVKSDGDNMDIINATRKIWTKILPATDFDYVLLNDRISSFYENEKKQVKTITFFAFLAIFLCLMGLFGYVSLTLLKRTKEIGIRKVNGARTSEILFMLNHNFIIWITIAFVIVCPIAWYAMRKWLENFAYKTELSWWIFAIAGLSAMILTLITTSFQSRRTASKNPVESLRYE